MTEKKLEVGDRVAVYNVNRVVGVVQAVGLESTDKSGKIYPMIDVSGAGYVHPKQCRRLKPRRKAREFWLTKQNAGERMAVCDVYCSDPRESPEWKSEWKVLHVREVLPGKGV